MSAKLKAKKPTAKKVTRKVIKSSSKKSKSPNKAHNYNDQLASAISCALEYATSASDKDFLKGLRSFGKKSGMLTQKQMQYLGSLYKRVVNNGKFVKHDWWT